MSKLGLGDSMNILEYQNSFTIIYYLLFEKLPSDSN